MFRQWFVVWPPPSGYYEGRARRIGVGRNGLIKMDKGVSEEQRAGCNGKGDLSKLMATQGSWIQ